MSDSLPHQTTHLTELCFSESPPFLILVLGYISLAVPTGQHYRTQFQYNPSNDSTNCLHHKRHSRIGYICFPFHHRAFSYVSSKHLEESRHIRIGCTYLTFLHCGFLNVSLNNLCEKRHSHICCTCLTFLYCAFSNDSSNCLSQKRHSRIGCICLAFDHCVFSSVFLKHLAQSRHSHIGCIYLTFLHCGFVKCLHKLLDFSSLCVLKYILKSPDHIALFAFVWVFSTVCFQMCPQIGRPRR